MQRVCAWCGNTLESTDDTDARITHTICPECFDNIFNQMGVGLQRYIDSLQSPVVVINADGEVANASTSACEMLGKEQSDIENQRGGIVFECAYARLPGGCGHTVHCSGCTIRQTVMDTSATGQSHVRVPASLQQHGPAVPQEIELRITTEKAGDIVLLRIDEVKAAGTKSKKHSSECA